jgi:hypothetical protein
LNVSVSEIVAVPAVVVVLSDVPVLVVVSDETVLTVLTPVTVVSEELAVLEAVE